MERLPTAVSASGILPLPSLHPHQHSLHFTGNLQYAIRRVYTLYKPFLYAQDILIVLYIYIYTYSTHTHKYYR